MDMNPSALDAEIRNLSPRDYRLFLAEMQEQIASGKNYEMAQTILNMFLKEHGLEMTLGQSALRMEIGGAAMDVDGDGDGDGDVVDDEVLEGVIKSVEEGWTPLEDLFNSTLAVLDFIRNG
jgi:hypothetical protein